MRLLQVLKQTPQIALGQFVRGQHYIRRKEGWESAIGLEVHAQIATKSKLFSPAPCNYGAPVNTQVALLDAATPGTLPVLNRKSVEAAVLTGLALSCRINPVSTFDRKHYFYADLPAGYQITQQRNPIASNGKLDFIVYTPSCHPAPYNHSCNIIQLQLEQDSGKSLHDEVDQRSLIDLNRAGIALMEIVFEPNLRDGEEASALIKELTLILQRIQTCDCKMEEGSLRVDANISVNRIGEPLGVRTEIKNLSSIRSIVNSIEYEVVRQIDVLEKGGEVINETRSFDSSRKETVPMRDKEMKQDYRFMPEPNLPPIRLLYEPNASSSSGPNILHVQRKMKELPEVTRNRLVKKYGIRMQSAIVIVSSPGLLEYFTAVMSFKNGESAVKVTNVLQGALMEILNINKIDYSQCPIKPKDVADIVSFLESSRINTAQSEIVLKKLLDDDARTPEQIIKEEGLEQISEDSEIEKMCLEVLKNNAKLVEGYKRNPSKFQKKILGTLDAAGKGKLNMKKASEIMLNLLKKD
ncbi:unnamed protein product [Allacma fusca]|uniref:Glutamyl-tRNA(Gln) amidotransferase subunit B, mitochondrial n=1 Tax=Allacma fusca TaxID=39272 RepID=A0A8J2KHA7_9HEXA|nr:unnamed protein product [Allacma fusca]